MDSNLVIDLFPSEHVASVPTKPPARERSTPVEKPPRESWWTKNADPITASKGEPMPRPKSQLTEEQRKEKQREYQRNWAAKKNGRSVGRSVGRKPRADNSGDMLQQLRDSIIEMSAQLVDRKRAVNAVLTMLGQSPEYDIE